MAIRLPPTQAQQRRSVVEALSLEALLLVALRQRAGSTLGEALLGRRHRREGPPVAAAKAGVPLQREAVRGEARERQER